MRRKTTVYVEDMTLRQLKRLQDLHAARRRGDGNTVMVEEAAGARAEA